MSNNSEFLSVNEFAELIGVTPGTVRRWMTEGTAPKSIKVGTKLVRFPRAEVDAWLGEAVA